MNRHNVFVTLLVLICVAASLAPAAAQQPVTPPAPILVNSPIVTMNNSAGNQTDLHISGDIAGGRPGLWRTESMNVLRALCEGRAPRTLAAEDLDFRSRGIGS